MYIFIILKKKAKKFNDKLKDSNQFCNCCGFKILGSDISIFCDNVEKMAEFNLYIFF